MIPTMWNSTSATSSNTQCKMQCKWHCIHAEFMQCSYRCTKMVSLILRIGTLARRLYQGSSRHATEICKYDANMHPRCKSRAGKANRVPKGTGQGSVAAGSSPASTLLPSATYSDFAPKPHRPKRPTTIPSAPPMLRLQTQFRND